MLVKLPTVLGFYPGPRLVALQAEGLGRNLASARFLICSRSVLSSMLPLRSVGRSNLDKDLHNLAMVIAKNDIKITKIKYNIYRQIDITLKNSTG